MSSLEGPTSRRTPWVTFLVPVGISCVVMVLATLALLSFEVSSTAPNHTKSRRAERKLTSTNGLEERDEAEPASIAESESVGVGPSSPPKRRRGFSPVLGSDPRTPSSAPLSQADANEGLSEEDIAKRRKGLRRARRTLGIFGGRKETGRKQLQTESSGAAGAGAE